MPVVIEKQAMKYRNPDGSYSGFNAVAQEGAKQQIAEITAAGANAVQAVNTAGQTALTEIGNAGNAAENAIQQKGADTLASIPEDYTQLTEDVADLKSALKSGNEEDAIYHLGFYLDENGDLCQVEEETNNG